MKKLIDKNRKWISIVLLVLACVYTVDLFVDNLVSVDKMATLTAKQQAMDFDQLRAELLRTRTHHYTIIKRLYISLFIIYLGGGGIVSYISLKRKKRREEYYFQIGENIREITQLRQRDDEHSSRLLRELLTREYQAMDEKCREYYECSSYVNKKGVSTEAEEMIARLSSAEQLEELETTVNKYQSDIMVEFRRDLPALKPADYSLFLYSILGFSPTAVSVFLKTDKLDSVYNRKARLKAKIRQLDDERQQQKYLSYL